MREVERVKERKRERRTLAAVAVALSKRASRSLFSRSHQTRDGRGHAPDNLHPPIAKEPPAASFCFLFEHGWTCWMGAREQDRRRVMPDTEDVLGEHWERVCSVFVGVRSQNIREGRTAKTAKICTHTTTQPPDRRDIHITRRDRTQTTSKRLRGGTVAERTHDVCAPARSCSGAPGEEAADDCVRYLQPSTTPKRSQNNHHDQQAKPNRAGPFEGDPQKEQIDV